MSFTPSGIDWRAIFLRGGTIRPEDAIRCFDGAGAGVNFEEPVFGGSSSILHEAVAAGRGDQVMDMLKRGADLNARDEDGDTPLHLAAIAGHGRIAATLVQRGADKDALNNGGTTPLYKAADAGHLRVVKILLALGADFNIRTGGGHSPLQAAAGGGHVPAVHAILDRGADINGRDREGFAAIHTAVHRDLVEVIDALVAAGADIELRSNFGYTPFGYGSLRSSCNSMAALRRHGASVTARDNKGNTALHLACLRSCQGLHAAVDLLLRWGADETALNNRGQTPGDILEIQLEQSHNLWMFDEMESAQWLLDRAPQDRAWYRRGWLVMLQSRHSKASERRTGDGEFGGGRGGGCETEDTYNSNRGFGTADAEERLRVVVLPLLGRGFEGVFRTVVGFL